ncbi:hypothetical protein GCM10008023_39030 [Sphingomonas glacialis]|uniref:Pentapeptide MXKDX repeat protein n=1 Tax=Sphingomonas glacialis TaxID=658225 RepID=A0ABQ3LZL4_9SPHN|nr:hypothetical protein [Sphingomonas glacialis]GHH25569.1 hypothetical protein GCM10008023_39030 [Sphingomonas glacialis]
MILKKLALGSIALVLATGAPAFAQNGMMSSGGMQPAGMKITKSQMASMNRCKKMSHHMMTKNRTCMKMMRMHPDMISEDGIMNDGKMDKKH